MFHFVSIGLCECMYGWSVYFHSLLIIRMLVIALEFHIFRGVQCLGLVLPYIPYVDSALHQLWNSGDILTKEGSVLVILVFTMQPVIRVMKPHVPRHAVHQIDKIPLRNSVPRILWGTVQEPDDLVEDHN